MARNEYRIMWEDKEIYSRHKQDNYDVWSIVVLESENSLPGDMVENTFIFDNSWSRDQFETEEGYVWIDNNTLEIEGMRHHIGGSFFYDEQCTVWEHVDYVYKK